MESAIVTVGESMGLITADTGGFRRAGRATVGFGGAESNVAIGVMRLGGRAVWAGRLGRDALGERIERELRAEGVVPLVQHDEERRTGLMLKEWPVPGVTRVAYYRAESAGSRVEYTPELAQAIASTQVLHVSGITPALSDRAAATIAASVAAAKRAGVPVSFDVNYRSALWSERAAAAALAPILRDAQIVFAGMEEAEMLVGRAGSTIELAHRISELGPSEVLIKLGADGCVGVVDGVEVAREAIPVQVVDTVGAGDAFVAGYLAERGAGAAVEERLRTAVAAGAFTCRSHGDWDGLPTRAELGLIDPGAEPVLR